MSPKKLASYRFLRYLHLMSDIAVEISKVYLVLQRNEAVVADVKHELDRVDRGHGQKWRLALAVVPRKRW